MLVEPNRSHALTGQVVESGAVALAKPNRRSCHRASQQSVRDGDSSRRIAAGIALGMLIGLIPADSLLIWGFALLAVFTTVNLAAMIAAVFLFGWIGLLLDPVTHRLGAMVLSASAIEPCWVWLYDQPVIPWTRFNNTVVMGSLLVGLMLLVPVYAISRRLTESYGSAIHRRLVRNRFYRWLMAPVPAAALGDKA